MLKLTRPFDYRNVWYSRGFNTTIACKTDYVMTKNNKTETNAKQREILLPVGYSLYHTIHSNQVRLFWWSK